MKPSFAYFRMFDFTPTWLEARRWAFSQEHIVEADMHLNLESRVSKYNIAEEKIRKNWKYLKILAQMPGIKALFLSNRLGWGNPREESDVDLFFITSKNKIWTARFFTTAFAKLFHLRPTPEFSKDKLCLSFYLSEESLDLSAHRALNPDIYLIYWIHQLIPIFDPENVHEKFLESNAWTKTFLPHASAYGPTPRRKIKKFFFKNIVDLLLGEKIFRNIQIKILPEKLKILAREKQGVVISNTMLKFHDKDRRKEYQHQWEKLCARS